MTGPDTTREGVERLAETLDRRTWPVGEGITATRAHHPDDRAAAATLRALLAERDALQHDLTIARVERDHAQRLANEARQAEQDADADLAAARAEAQRMREAGRPLHAAAVAAVGSLKPSDHKRAALAIACRDWRAALEGRADG